MTRPPPSYTISSLGSRPNRPPINGNGEVRSEQAPADDQVLLEVVDGVVRGIFSVVLMLSAARSLTEGPVTARLDQALDGLYDLVIHVRHSALTADHSDPPTTRPASDLVDQAVVALTEVDAVLIRLWNDAVTDAGDDPTGQECITNAARFVRLAKNTLTATGMI